MSNCRVVSVVRAITDEDQEKAPLSRTSALQIDATERLKEVHDAISTGAEAFLRSEYSYCLVFETIFAVVIFILTSAGQNPRLGILTTIAFVLGACTSILSG